MCGRLDRCPGLRPLANHLPPNEASTETMTGTIDSRLAQLGIDLSSPPAPVASYVPYVVVGNLVFVSGQVTLAKDGLKYVGVVGKELSLDDGKAAARLCAINVLAQLKAAVNGNLDRVRRCVR